MIKCTNCQYYIADNKGYPFCCLYCMEIDKVAIFDLCAFVEKEEKEEEDD